MNKKLKVGIAGYGIVGKRRHDFIKLNPHLEVVAVADRSYQTDAVLADGVKTYQSFDKLITTEQLDMLFVCLSNDVAANAVCAGLERGFNIFCEKPPGRSLADIRQVLKVHQKYPHLKLKYGFNHRYHESIKRALDIIKKKELGEIINIRGVYGKSVMVNFSSDWRHDRSVAGGGILLDQGIHMVDLIRLFGGEYTEIYSFISNDYWKYDVEDNAYALMKSDNGIVAMLHSTATEWRHRFNLQINLTAGTLILSGILSGTKSYGQEELHIIYKGESDKGNPKDICTTFIEDNSWKEEIDEFTDCVLNNKPIVEGSVLDAFKTMELVFKIYCADKNWAQKYKLEL